MVPRRKHTCGLFHIGVHSTHKIAHLFGFIWGFRSRVSERYSKAMFRGVLSERHASTGGSGALLDWVTKSAPRCSFEHYYIVHNISIHYCCTYTLASHWPAFSSFVSQSMVSTRKAPMYDPPCAVAETQ